MEEYPSIKFELKLQIPEHIHMKTTDLLSLLTIIIDGSCEMILQNHGDLYYLEMIGNDNELSICEKCFFDCLISYDSFRKVYLKELIQKYDGDIFVRNVNQQLAQYILLLL